MFLRFLNTLTLITTAVSLTHAPDLAAQDRPSTVDSRPNVVVILTDDQGWGDLSLNGNTNLETPNIDGMAKAGARFDRFYVCPVCSPTRAEFLTGRYHPRGGVYSTSAGGERLDLDERTIGETFRAVGYATAAFGKWHNGMQYPYHPNGRGFDEFYGFCSGHWGDYFSPPLDHNGKIVRGEGFIIDDLTNKAMTFIEEHRDEPFFVYLPYNTPHSPMQVPDRFWDKFKDHELGMRHRDDKKDNGGKLGHNRAALAMCENIDWNVGRLLNKLDTLQLADNTIVVYFCDNGPNGTRWNGGMKGRKGSTDEGGVRSPLLVRWPKHIPPGHVVTPISAAIDLLPTLADLAGIDVVGEKPLDGRSLKPLLVGYRDPDDVKTWPKRTIFSTWRGRVSARTQRFRLDHAGKLYDMVADPGQRTDIADQHPEIAKKLRHEVDEWKKTVVAELGKDDRTFPLGDAEYRYTQIPARDAAAHGKLQRSNRFPNCSYFTNWTSVEDRLMWPVDVQAAGDYEVELHYACRAADVGSTMELAIGSKRITGTITEANEVPERGGENDRVTRMESYVKDFRPMKFGTIRLDKGPAELSLRALKIPGSEAIEFRLLMFTRVDQQ